MSFGNRMNDFAFEIVSEPEEKEEEFVATSQEEWDGKQKKKADAILKNLGV
jgi:hypothetical protein